MTKTPPTDDSPLGRRFPSVAGSALAGETVRLPDDVAGAPAVLIVAYQRAAQADVDRWLGFLSENEPQLVVYELPTIPALVYRPLAGWIDRGMRGGVPRELWSRVVTLYSDGGPVRDFLGDPGFAGASVVLIDGEGVVRWYATWGFTQQKGAALRAALNDLVR